MAADIAKHTLGSTQAITYLMPESGRTGMTSGAQVDKYINKITGEIIAVVASPHMPQGTLIAVTERISYPGTDSAKTLEVSTARDVSQEPYGATHSEGAAGYGPRIIWDQSSMETLINRAPVACGILQNVQRG